MTKKNFLCSVKDVEPGKKKRFVIGEEKIMLANVDGKFYAVEDTCTHATASLTAGTLRGCEIECPRHGARFDIRTGEVIVLPAVIPLKTYKLLVENNQIYVLLEAADASEAVSAPESSTTAPPEIECSNGVCRLKKHA